jgi:hypothetical protein
VNLATRSTYLPFTSHLPNNVHLATHSIYLPFTSHLPDNVNLATRYNYLSFTLHLPENQGVQNVIQSSTKPPEMLTRPFPTHNQVFKVQSVPRFSGNVPFTCHFPEKSKI